MLAICVDKYIREWQYNVAILLHTWNLIIKTVAVVVAVMAVVVVKYNKDTVLSVCCKNTMMAICKCSALNTCDSA